MLHFPPQWRTACGDVQSEPQLPPPWSLTPAAKVGIKPTCGALRDSVQEAARSPQTVLSPASSRPPANTPPPPPRTLLWLSLCIFTGKTGAGGGAAHTTARGSQGAKVALNSKTLLGALTSNRGRDVHRNLTTSSPSPPA